MRGQDLLTALADELKGIAPELVQAYDAENDTGAASHAYVTTVGRLSEAAGRGIDRASRPSAGRRARRSSRSHDPYQGG